MDALKLPVVELSWKSPLLRFQANSPFSASLEVMGISRPLAMPNASVLSNETLAVLGSPLPLLMEFVLMPRPEIRTESRLSGRGPADRHASAETLSWGGC